ncbi:hypothetical protein NBM05_04870 [Rothia sp. AR01]|uniref:Uncharacterized protein n=1 Tax=Rothia santali TaxID=2949643 RepID=A0A9X2KHW7_9MICC|nr:hypothetical protein [Rothia santali]MCP3425365.1 hypothetical protein [Rothia santali]
MSENSPETPGRISLSQEQKDELVRHTRRTDLRRIIGGLFLVYGVVVTLMGVLDPAADTAPTGGIHINLWAGASMIVAAGLFFLWDRLAPVPAEDIVASAEAEEIKKAEGEGKLD